MLTISDRTNNGKWFSKEIKSFWRYPDKKCGVELTKIAQTQRGALVVFEEDAFAYKKVGTTEFLSEAVLALRIPAGALGFLTPSHKCRVSEVEVLAYALFGSFRFNWGKDRLNWRKDQKLVKLFSNHNKAYQYYVGGWHTFRQSIFGHENEGECAAGVHCFRTIIEAVYY